MAGVFIFRRAINIMLIIFYFLKQRNTLIRTITFIYNIVLFDINTFAVALLVKRYDDEFVFGLFGLLYHELRLLIYDGHKWFVRIQSIYCKFKLLKAS